MANKRKTLAGAARGGNGQENCRLLSIHGILNIIECLLGLLPLFTKLFWYTVKAIYNLIYPVPQKPVKGEVVLVTGAGHGIGRELAVQYASKGATVVCWDNNKLDNEETVEMIADLGYPRAHHYICNLANRNHVSETAKKVKNDVGDVTVVINCEEATSSRPLLEHTQEEIETIIDTNVLAYIWILQTFLPAMISKEKGHILNVSSSCGLFSVKNHIPYSCSKSAVRSIVEGLHQELGADENNNVILTTIYYSANKKPDACFRRLLPALKPSDIAESIINAQRQNVVEASIPSWHMAFYHCFKLAPFKVQQVIYGFITDQLLSHN